MKLIETILRFFGFVRMRRFGLTLTRNGRLLDAHGRDVAGPDEPPLPLGLPIAIGPGDAPLSARRAARRPRATTSGSGEHAAWKRRFAEADARAIASKWRDEVDRRHRQAEANQRALEEDLREEAEWQRRLDEANQRVTEANPSDGDSGHDEWDRALAAARTRARLKTSTRARRVQRAESATVH